MSSYLPIATFAALLFLNPVGAEECAPPPPFPAESAHHEHQEETSGHDLGSVVDWKNGQGFGLGGFLFPELFVLGTAGDSTGDLGSLAVSDHDPHRSAVLQSLHAAMMLQAGDWLTGMANLEGAGRADGTVSAALEEGFIHIHPTNWLAIGGGQFLSAFGFQNERHVHAWDFVDQYLVNGRMLNEGELMMQGGEVILGLPTPWQSVLTIGGGGARIHGHGDGEGDHDHHDEEADFEADRAGFNDWLLTGNYTARYGKQDQMAGMLSYAVGENGFGETTQVYGIGHEIVWDSAAGGHTCESGATASTPPGRGWGTGSLQWRTEALFRSIEAITGGEEHGHEEEGHAEESESARLDEFGVYSMLKYGLSPRTSLAFRAEWVSGIDEMGLEERWRLSPALTAYLNPARTIHARLQYNYDHGRHSADDHTVWFQVGIAWGGGVLGAHGHEH